MVGLVVATSVRTKPRRQVARFRNLAELERAVEHGALDLVDCVSLGSGGARVETTVGRALLLAALEEAVPLDLVNRPIDAPAVAEMATAVYDTLGSAAARAALRGLSRFGGRVAEAMGLSLTAEDFSASGSEPPVVERAWEAVRTIATEYQAGLITDGERYNRVVDVWWQARQTTDEALQPRRGTLGALAATSLAASAAVQEVRRTLELASHATGEIREMPVLHGLGEGRTPHEVFALATGRPAVRSTDGQSLRERLRAAYADIHVVADDCGSTDGLAASSVVHERRVLRPLSRRLEGRVAAERIAARDGSTVVAAGHVIEALHARQIDALRCRRAVARSPVTCRAMGGVCARCYGWDPAHRSLPAIGTAIGERAAEAIAETALALSPPGFTVSGAVYRWASRLVPAPRTGFVRYDGVDLTPGEEDLHGPAGARVVNRDARITLRDDLGRELVRYELEPGDIVRIDDGDRVSQEGEFFFRVLGPHRPFDDLDRPWWGGRDDLIGLLDVRDPDRPTVFAATEGVVRFVTRAGRGRCDALVIVPDDGSRGPYHRATGRHVTVSDGQHVRGGDQLLLGEPRFEHALSLGEPEGAQVLVALLAKAVARGGGRIADVHLEVAVRALLSRVRVVEPGDTGLTAGMIVPREVVRARADGAVLEHGRHTRVQLILTSLDDLARPPGLLARSVHSVLRR